jgi:predicted RND superfamily exporter protein
VRAALKAWLRRALTALRAGPGQADAREPGILDAAATALARLVARHPRAIVVGSIALTLGALLVHPLAVGHDYADWIDHDSTHYRAWAGLARDFGDADTVMAAFDVEVLEDDARRAAYFDLVAGLRAAPGVAGVVEPLAQFLGADRDFPPDSVDRAILADALAARSNDYRHLLVSRDAGTMALLVLLDPDQRAAHAAAVHALVDGLGAAGIPAAYAGTAYFSSVLADTIGSDLGRVIVLLLGVAVAVLAYFLREPRVVAAILAGVAVAAGAALAIASACGLDLNLLTLLLMPLVLGVVLTTAVHLFTRRVAGAWRYEQAIASVLAPATSAALTTALGCLSFHFAPQTLIARMGLVMPLAVLAAFAIALVFVPALLAWLAPHATLPPLRSHRLAVPRGARGAVALGLLVTAIVAGSALPRLATNPDALFFFAADSQVMRDYRHIEQRLAGLLTVDLVIRAPAGVAVREGAPAAAIAQFAEALAALPELTTIVAGHDLDWLALLGLERVPGLGGALYTRDGSGARLVLRLRNVDARPWREIAADIAKRWDGTPHGALELEVTGLVPLILEAQDRLLHVQGRMLPLVLGIICLAMLVLYRRPSVLVAAVAANFIPLVVTAGAMAWCGIALNSINLFVGSVMLGIVVDDTIHLLHAWHRHGRVAPALAEVGDALWVTSVTVALAFAALAASSLVPVREFGLLSVLAVATAWLGDTCLLPVLLERLETRA